MCTHLLSGKKKKKHKKHVYKKGRNFKHELKTSTSKFALPAPDLRHIDPLPTRSSTDQKKGVLRFLTFRFYFESRDRLKFHCSFTNVIRPLPTALHVPLVKRRPYHPTLYPAHISWTRRSDMSTSITRTIVRTFSTARTVLAPPRGSTTAAGSVLASTSSKQPRWIELGADYPSSRMESKKQKAALTILPITTRSQHFYSGQIDSLYDEDLGMAWPSSRLY